MAHGPSCPAACGIFPDQGSNPCPLHCQADSQPLRHQGSPPQDYFNIKNNSTPAEKNKSLVNPNSTKMFHIYTEVPMTQEA